MVNLETAIERHEKLMKKLEIQKIYRVKELKALQAFS